MRTVFTSGLVNALNLDQQDRRYLVVENNRPTPEQQAKLNEELVALEKQARLREIQRDFGPGAVQVASYKPNRKQKRAQEAAKRKAAKGYPLRRKEYKRDE